MRFLRRCSNFQMATQQSTFLKPAPLLASVLENADRCEFCPRADRIGALPELETSHCQIVYAAAASAWESRDRHHRAARKCVPCRPLNSFRIPDVWNFGAGPWLFLLRR